MNKVLVDRDLLDSAATWLEVHAPGGGCVEGSVAEDLRAILAQPADAEGVEVVAWQQRYICPDEGPSCWQSADERTVEILRRRDDYELRQLVPLTALSAVTAERDRLRDDRDSQQRVCIAEMEKANQLRAEVESLRKDATGRAAFKNFHRSLCERFGYTHDDEFWWRDLISLEEHIAKLTAPKPVSSALADVDAERRRQIAVEGWTPEHDDEHSNGEMALAAACYARHAIVPPALSDVPATWPWHRDWWKPAGARRNLVKTAALILAEIERLDRAAARGGA